MFHIIIVSTIDCCYTYRTLSIIVLLHTTVDLHLTYIWSMKRYSEIIYLFYKCMGFCRRVEALHL